MTRIASRIALAATLVAASLVGACGGDPARPAVTEQVPASASESVDGFIAYLKELVVASADTLEPVDTTGVTPPVDDTREPDPSV